MAAFILSDSGIVMSVRGIRHLIRDKAEYKSVMRNGFFEMNQQSGFAGRREDMERWPHARWWLTGPLGNGIPSERSVSCERSEPRL